MIANSKQQTANSKQQTANSKLTLINSNSNFLDLHYHKIDFAKFPFVIIQIAIDIILYLACLYVAYGLKILPKNISIALSGILVICFAFNSLYKFNSWTFWDEVKAVLQSALLIFLVSILYLYAVKIKISSLSFVIGIIIFIPVCLAVRYFLRTFSFKTGLLSTSIIIIGAGEAGALFAKKVLANKFMACKILAFVDDDITKHGHEIYGIKIMGGIQNLEAIQNNLHASEAVIAIPTASRTELANILEHAEDYFNKVRYIPDMYMLTTLSASIININGMPIISASQGLLNPVNRFIKSIMDYAGGTLALILFSPLMLYAAIKIKHDDGHNILFKHKRVGQNMTTFEIFKFRTMVPDAENKLQEMLQDPELKHEFETAFKFKDDPRITKVGKFLRRTSLDELPQIFNVLRGEMSLVGPRPIVQKEIELYYGKETAKQIFHVKPGLTGFWQVSGRNDVKDYDTRIRFDLYYIHNWSIWLDLIIILRTIKAVCSGAGAY